MKFFIIVVGGLTLSVALISFSLSAKSPQTNCAQAQLLANEFYALVVRPQSDPKDLAQLEGTLSSLLQAKQMVCSGQTNLAADAFLGSMNNYIEEIKTRHLF